MNDLLNLHKQMYDVRWTSAIGDPEQLEKEFMSMVKLEEVDLEKANEMLEQLYIPPYSESLPEHLKTKKHGGKREGAGRKSIGVTKRATITLPEELWEKIEDQKEEEGISLAALLRDIVEHYYMPDYVDLKKEDKKND